MKKNKPKPIGDILENVLKRIGVYENFRIQSEWESIVGKEIAAVTEPFLLEDRTLEIRVKNMIWKRELELMGGKIKEEVNTFLKRKNVDRIVFKTGLRRRQI